MPDPHTGVYCLSLFHLILGCDFIIFHMTCYSMSLIGLCWNGYFLNQNSSLKLLENFQAACSCSDFILYEEFLSAVFLEL